MGFLSGILSSVAGPVVGGLLGLAGQSSANKANADLAASNNQTSIDLANTAHQREVKDLMSAGLNPMLSYHTSGAATPTLQLAKMENTADSASRSASAASTIGVNSMQNQLIKSQIDTQASQADLNSASAAKIRAEIGIVPLQGANLSATTDHIREQINALGYTNALTRSEREKVDAEILNAVQENRRIRADTGNKVADTALKAAEKLRVEAELPLIKSKSFFGNAAEQGAKTVGESIGTSAGAAHMYIEDLKNSMRARRSAYEKR